MQSELLVYKIYRN